MEKLSIDIRSELNPVTRYINSYVLDSSCNWAIVGGYIRDTIISKLINKNINSPDIDIAVKGKLPVIKKSREVLDVSTNSFGGLKIITKKYGEIDIWNVEDNSFNNKIKFWDCYLNNIDFVINSIIFIYPEKNLIIHDDWLKSFKQRSIEQLHPYSKKKNVQTIRAYALSYNLSEKTGLDFSVSKKLEDKLRILNSSRNKNSFEDAIKYAQNKINADRWEKGFINQFYAICSNM